MTDAPDARRAAAVTVEEARRAVARQVRRARRTMALERALAALWPVWAVLGTFLGLALAGAHEIADRKSTRLNSSHVCSSRMPSSA